MRMETRKRLTGLVTYRSETYYYLYCTLNLSQNFPPKVGRLILGTHFCDAKNGNRSASDVFVDNALIAFFGQYSWVLVCWFVAV